MHFAPQGARDVGYIGLANVLLRQGYLNEAVIMARASLDINENSVSEGSGKDPHLVFKAALFEMVVPV